MGNKKKEGLCQWCNKRHPHKSTALCYIQNEKEIRSRLRPRVKVVGDAYEEGRLKGVFSKTDMEEILLKRQRTLAVNALLADRGNGYKVPNNVAEFVRQGFVWNQVAVQRPWAVYVLVNGKRKRKRFNNLRDAIEFHEKVHHKHPSSGIVSVCAHYTLPPEWLEKKDKLPRKFKWCPRCAAFRVFRLVEPAVKFPAVKKVILPDGKYKWVERLVRLTACQLCGCTNREEAYRRANQPYEVRKVKAGARKIKARGADTRTIRKSRERTARKR